MGSYTAVAANVSNGAALVSSTDYSFKWGTDATPAAIAFLLLQNNTGSDLQWELDAAATAGSAILPTGQTLLLPAAILVLHLFQAGTPNVNGATAGNIVVRGWI
jgi:hypothetical protein